MGTLDRLMEDRSQRYDDISEVAEALWGPCEESEPAGSSANGHTASASGWVESLWGPREERDLEPGLPLPPARGLDLPAPPDLPTAPDAERWAALESHVREAMGGLAEKISASQAASQMQLDAALGRGLAELRAEVLAAGDARFAAAKAEHERQVTSSLEAAAARAGALDQDVSRVLATLAESLEARHAQSLGTLRSELLADLSEHVTRLERAVDANSAASTRAVDERLSAFQGNMRDAITRLAASLETRHIDSLATLRYQQERDLAEQLGQLRAELKAVLTKQRAATSASVRNAIRPVEQEMDEPRLAADELQRSVERLRRSPLRTAASATAPATDRAVHRKPAEGR